MSAQSGARDPDLAARVRDEIQRYRESGEIGDATHIEPRCRVCQNPSVRWPVNRMLAYGMTYRDILDSLEPVNATLPRNKRVTYRSLWMHTRTHFRADEPAQALYRNILEKRAIEHGNDVVEGVETLIDEYSYLETMMVKGYRNLVHEGEVSVADGMKAAVKLREMGKEDSSGQRVGDLMRQMDRIVNAVLNVVPERYHSEILSQIEGRQAAALPVDAEVVPEDHDEDDMPVIDPGEDHDDRDDWED